MVSRHSSLMALTSMFLLLTACAGGGEKTESTVDPNVEGIYLDGKEKLLGEMLADITSAEEAEKLGDQALQQESFDRAVLYYVRSYSLNTENVGVLEKLGYLYAKRGERRLADLAYQAVLKQNPGHAVANEQIGLIRLYSRQYVDAKSHFQKALAADPKRPESLNGLGLIEDLAQNYHDASTYYERALMLDRQSVSTLNNIAYSSYLSGDVEAARRYLKLALALEPGYQRALENFGLIEARERHYDASVYYFSRVFGLQAAYNNVGYICMINGDLDQAEEYFVKAIKESDSYYSKAHENLKQVQVLQQSKDVPIRATEERAM